MSLKTICQECKKFRTCKEPCEEVEKLLPKSRADESYTKIEPEMLAAPPSFEHTQDKNLQEVMKEESQRGRSSWEPEELFPRIPEEAFKRLISPYNYLFKSRHNKKLFLTYLSDKDCTLEKLADINGVTLQAIQKQFTYYIKKLVQVVSKGKVKTFVTPYDFKKNLRLYEKDN
jgi:hypothetical protein